MKREILKDLRSQKKDNDAIVFNFSSARKKFLNYIIIAIIWGFLIGFLVWLSWYENDYKVTKNFGDLGYNNYLFYIIGDFLVSDGYFSLTSLAIPLVIIFFEEILIYFKKYFYKSKVFMFIWRTRKYYEYIALISWTINMAIMIWTGYSIYSTDRGFGPWVNQKSLVPSDIYRILAIITYVIQNLVCWTVGIYVIHFLTNKPEFSQGQYWKKCLYLIAISSILYAQMEFFKSGTQRPLFYQIIWGDLLEDFKHRDFAAWENYMNQDVFKFGLIFGEPIPGYINNGYRNLPGNWEWWKVYPGGFLPGKVSPLPIDVKYFRDKDRAFPSGHMQSTFSWMIAMWIYTSQNRKTKLGQTSKYTLIGIGFGYNVIMFNALGLTYGHWMSDMIFTICMIPIWHFAALGLVKLGIKFGNYLDKKIIVYADKITQKHKQKKLTFNKN